MLKREAKIRKRSLRNIPGGQTRKETHPLVWAEGESVVPLAVALLGVISRLFRLLGAEHPFVVQVPGKIVSQFVEADAAQHERDCAPSIGALRGG